MTYGEALLPGVLLDARGELGEFRLVPHLCLLFASVPIAFLVSVCLTTPSLCLLYTSDAADE